MGPDIVAKRVLCTTRGENRRFLISETRATRRPVKNERDGWLDLLEHRRLELLYLEELSVLEQALMLAVAVVIITPHGT